MHDGGLGVMHPATALMSVLLVGRMFSGIMNPAALSTYDSSALGDCPVAGTKVSCYTITTISVNITRARYDFVASNNSVPVDMVRFGRYVEMRDLLTDSLSAWGGQ